jgi:UDP-N-acetylglucosamine/UDP-N-acetylgalactosamine diphosphorylase
MTISPYLDVKERGNASWFKAGKEALYAGRVGTIVVAGGQGTRLGFHAPKGLFPISVVHGKSLFQVLAERVAAASKVFSQPLPLAIMTSEDNHAGTISYFEEHKYFGLDSSQVHFFKQVSLLLQDDNQQSVYSEPGVPAKAASGNGAVFKHFAESGILKQWKQEGIDLVNFVQIDNPLADPFDAEIIGFHLSNNLDLGIQVVKKAYPDEKVGVLMQDTQGLRVIEYTNLNEELKKDPKLFANISRFTFSLSLMERAAHVELPKNLAHKPTKIWTGEAYETKKVWKTEYFVFDVFPFAKKADAIAYPRAECFSPLKNPEGNDSPETVKKDLLALHRRIYKDVMGKEPDEAIFELDPILYYFVSV